MKILFCTNSFQTITNGPAKFANLLLSLNTMEQGIDLRILTEDTDQDQPKVYQLKMNIPFYMRKAGMFLRMFRYHKRAMEIYHAGFKFDILIYNNATIGLRSALGFSPVIGFINDDNNASVKFFRDFLKPRWLKSTVFSFTEWLAGKLVDKVVVNSDYMRTTLQQAYHIKPSKLFRLYKAVEVENFYQKRDNKVPVILFVKNDYKRGGLFILAEALKKLEFKTKCIVAGTDPSEADRILKLFESPIIEFELKGYQPQEIIYQLMRDADIFCVPSLKEALGVSNIEAMRLGCAVITTNAGGIPEVTDFGRCAFIAETGNADDLANVITKAVDDHVLREQKIYEAHLFSEKFSVQQMFTNFLSLIKEYETAGIS